MKSNAYRKNYSCFSIRLEYRCFVIPHGAARLLTRGNQWFQHHPQWTHLSLFFPSGLHPGKGWLYCCHGVSFFSPVSKFPLPGASVSWTVTNSMPVDQGIPEVICLKDLDDSNNCGWFTSWGRRKKGQGNFGWWLVFTFCGPVFARVYIGIREVGALMWFRITFHPRVRCRWWYTDKMHYQFNSNQSHIHRKSY